MTNDNCNYIILFDMFVGPLVFLCYSLLYLVKHDNFATYTMACWLSFQTYQPYKLCNNLLSMSTLQPMQLHVACQIYQPCNICILIQS